MRGSIDDRDFSAFFLRDATVVGAIGIGRPAEIRSARQWIAARQQVAADVLTDPSAELAASVMP